jgi:acetylornithine deacetylase/succinyl-diaminopimelate desuccinylase-like protein
MTSAHNFAKENQARFKDEFLDLLKIPSVSTDMAFKGDVRRAAEWIAENMRRIGLEAELITMPEGPHPLVLGQWNSAGANAKTVLVYCHYDVQPAVIEDGWFTNPFEPTEKDGKIFARGATDSKVHVKSWISAMESLLNTGGCPVNVKLLFEGEEESGSRTIDAFINQYPEKLDCDVVVISDGIIRAPEQPSLTYGLRGIITMELHVDGPMSDLHSGHFGGTVHNPVQALAEIISKLHDDNGRVTVPGFYDSVAELSAGERQLLAESNSLMEQEWRDVANPPGAWGESEFNLHERVGARPTLEINGIAGGYYGEGFKTVLPAHAFAKISCRLVPNQDPQEIMNLVQNYISEISLPTVRIEFKHSEAEAPAAILDYKSEAMQAAFRAYEQGWGVKPLFERAGGSVPITVKMQPLTPNVVTMGFSYKGGRAHGPNENIYVDMFYKGINTAIYFLQGIGK